MQLFYWNVGTFTCMQWDVKRGWSSWWSIVFCSYPRFRSFITFTWIPQLRKVHVKLIISLCYVCRVDGGFLHPNTKTVSAVQNISTDYLEETWHSNLPEYNPHPAQFTCVTGREQNNVCLWNILSLINCLMTITIIWLEHSLYLGVRKTCKVTIKSTYIHSWHSLKD